MHIPGNSFNVHAANLYSAAQGNQAAAAQRAAETRKKLLKSASALDSSCEPATTPEETLLISQWTDSRHSQLQPGVEYHSTLAGRDPGFN